MRQVEYSFALCKNTWVYSPTGRPTAFSIPLDEYLTDMGKQGWECCGWVSEGDGTTKMILEALCACNATERIRRPRERENFGSLFSRRKDATGTKGLNLFPGEQGRGLLRSP